MESPEQLEKALERLMPAAVSDRSQRELERTIDELAAGALTFRDPSAAPVTVRRSWWPLAIGMPAAAAAAFAVALWLPRPGQGPVANRGTGESLTESQSPAAAPAPKAMAHDPFDSAEVPSKVFDTARRTAELEWKEGGMMLVFHGETPHVTITTAEGATVYQGPLDSDAVPEPWKKRGEMLKRDLLKRIDARPPAVE